MSSRTAERNKAVRLAWEREQELVREGKGTRDWTRKQQQDILDPDKGKAYDEDVKAFEGQHMKSVAEYPDYRSNPDNIQFLTKEEHLEAHKSSWKNPTNWYYDPVTKEFTDFGDGDIIPCKIIELSDPLIVLSVTDSENVKEEEDSAKQKGAKSEENPDSERGSPQNKKVQCNHSAKAATAKSSIKKSESGFIRFLKGAGRFVVEHPLESIEIAGVVIGGAAKVVSSIAGSKNNSTYKSNLGTSSTASPNSDIATKVADIVEKANKSMPRENDVPRHKQRYYTKDGVIWKDKAPYHRGGKDS